MKFKNIFKKNTKAVIKANVQSLDKKQLEKVTGGAESTGQAGKAHFGSSASG